VGRVRGAASAQQLSARSSRAAGEAARDSPKTSAWGDGRGDVTEGLAPWRGGGSEAARALGPRQGTPDRREKKADARNFAPKTIACEAAEKALARSTG